MSRFNPNDDRVRLRMTVANDHAAFDILRSEHDPHRIRSSVVALLNLGLLIHSAGVLPSVVQTFRTRSFGPVLTNHPMVFRLSLTPRELAFAPLFAIKNEAERRDFTLYLIGLGATAAKFSAQAMLSAADPQAEIPGARIRLADQALHHAIRTDAGGLVADQPVKSLQTAPVASESPSNPARPPVRRPVDLDALDKLVDGVMAASEESKEAA